MRRVRVGVVERAGATPEPLPDASFDAILRRLTQLAMSAAVQGDSVFLPLTLAAEALAVTGSVDLDAVRQFHGPNDALTPAQVDAVADVRDLIVRELFAIGLMIQSRSLQTAPGLPMDDRLLDLVPVLEETIRLVRTDAFRAVVPCVADAVTAPPRDGSLLPDRGAGGRDLGPGSSPLRVPEDQVHDEAGERDPMTSAVAAAPDSRCERASAWTGDVTWREVPAHREALFDDLEAAGSVGVRLDVRDVTVLDRTGIALLIGANHRAFARGERLVLIDSGGPVTAALSRMHMIGDFQIVQRDHASEGSLAQSPADRHEVLDGAPWKSRATCVDQQDSFRLAVCDGVDPDQTQSNRQLALRYCADCRVFHQCEQYAVEHELSGLWAGRQYEAGRIAGRP